MAAVLALGAACPALAITYDAYKDFSIAANPNGVWTYGYGTPGVSFTALPQSAADFNGVSGVPAWISPDYPFLSVAANQSGGAWNIGGYTVPNALVLHPYDFGPAAILQFTAPVAGTYAYDFQFLDVDSGTVGISAFVNNAVLIPRTAGPGDVKMKGSVVLAAGDSLIAAVDADGSYMYDSTGLVAILSTDPINPPTGVPEPVSAALVGVGVGLLGLVRRRNGTFDPPAAAPTPRGAA